eukprot:15457493-Alexandrium_andersonii.AAC.1
MRNFTIPYSAERTAPGASPGGLPPSRTPGWRLRRGRPLWGGYRPPGPPDWRLRRAGGASL